MRYFFFIVIFLGACTKLNTPVESQYTPVTPVTPSDYVSALGSIYSQLAHNTSGTRYAVEYWRLQELSTDEAIIPARNGNYDDGGQYRLLHLHTWTSDHPTVTSVWQWGFQAINTCNVMLQQFAPAAASPLKTNAIAEAHAMRDLFYFFMLDLYGNIPIVDTVASTVAPATVSRAQAFAYIENDLKATLPALAANVDGTTYGHATKWMAFALLEKMYLNAQVYTGTPRYSDAVAMADSILLEAPYALDANYGSIFAPTNGPGVKETIFAIPYDANLIQGNQMTRYGFATYVYPLYNLPNAGSIAMSTDSGFYHQNFILPGDTRDTFWLRGPQHYFPDQAINTSIYPASILPVLNLLYPAAIYPATNIALYANYDSMPLPHVLYSLGMGSSDISFWQVTYTDSLVLRGDPIKMDVGDDVFAECEGIRSKKFYPDPNENPQTQDQNNDFPVFRLSDVLLMKAEAILRGAAATSVKGVVQTPATLVNLVRKRVGAQLTADPLTVDSLLPERAREFAWEGWRRNDLIRFGEFENAWGFKAANAAPSTYAIFPVPTTELSTNQNLKQNPGY
jgi:starch-binding outer membrane protein, SusD/RagB family